MTAAAFAGGFALRVDGESGCIRLPLPDGGFDLSWMHSVERTRWRETYSVGPGGEIVLTASAFASAGAGLPDRIGDGERFVASGGEMRIVGRRVPVGVLRIRLSGVSRHILAAGGRTIDLNARFGEGVVTIRAEEVPTIRGKGGCR